MVRRACELDGNSCQAGPALAFKNEILSDLAGFASATHSAKRLGRSTGRGGGLWSCAVPSSPSPSTLTERVWRRVPCELRTVTLARDVVHLEPDERGVDLLLDREVLQSVQPWVLHRPSRKRRKSGKFVLTPRLKPPLRRQPRLSARLTTRRSFELYESQIADKIATLQTVVAAYEYAREPVPSLRFPSGFISKQIDA
jgi:hypothetical protein